MVTSIVCLERLQFGAISARCCGRISIEFPILVALPMMNWDTDSNLIRKITYLSLADYYRWEMKRKSLRAQELWNSMPSSAALSSMASKLKPWDMRVGSLEQSFVDTLVSHMSSFFTR
jgi:hypothetical protein